MRQNDRIAHIARLARRLRYGIRTVVVLALVAVVVAVVNGQPTAQFVMGSLRLKVAEMSAATLGVLLLTMLPVIVIVAWLVWLCDRLLALYERGEIFSRANAALILRAGKLVVALSVVGSVLQPLAAWSISRTGVLVETWTFEPRLGTLFIGLGIVVVGHVMSLGAEIAEDQELTI